MPHKKNKKAKSPFLLDGTPEGNEFDAFGNPWSIPPGTPATWFDERGRRLLFGRPGMPEAADLRRTAQDLSIAGKEKETLESHSSVERRRPGVRPSQERVDIRKHINENMERYRPYLYERRTKLRRQKRRLLAEQIGVALKKPKDPMIRTVLREDYPYKRRNPSRL